MAVAYTTQNRALTVSLSGELDHHRVKGVIRELEGEIDRLLPQQLVVDCAGVTFLERGHRHFAAPVAADGGAGGEHPHPGPAGAAGTGVPGGGLGPAHPYRTHPGKE